MLIFVPVPAGNVPSQEKMRGGSEGAREGADLKLISHSYLETRGCRSSVQPSCATVMMVPSPLLWAAGSVSEATVLYHPSAEACSSDGLCQDSGSPDVHQNSSRTEKRSPSLLDRRVDWRRVSINASLIQETCNRNSCSGRLFSPADQAGEREDLRSVPPRRQKRSRFYQSRGNK